MEGSSMNFPTSDVQFLAQVLQATVSRLDPIGITESDRHRLQEIANKGFSSVTDSPDDGGGTV